MTQEVDDPSASGSSGSSRATAPDHDLRGVLAITPFRRLWMSLGLSSFGDWLGFMALGGFAYQLAGALGFSGVLVLRLAPAIVFGPVAGVVADRLDRRLTMVVGDVLRGVIFLSIPLVGQLWWVFVATVLVEVIGLFWLPAKDASVPNLVPARRLEAANQLQMATTYGVAPLAGLFFGLLALIGGALDGLATGFSGQVDLALYVNAVTYFVAAAVIWGLDIPPPTGAAASSQPTVLRSIVDGWRFVGSTPLVRGLVTGMLGAFAAAGSVLGLALPFVADLGAGFPGFGVLFSAVFVGLATGMWLGPRVLVEVDRSRLFGLALIGAGLSLVLLALMANIVLALVATAALGACAGVAWVTGYTLLGSEVADEIRGRTFAFVQSTARVVLLAVMALAPLVAAAIGAHTWQLAPNVSLTYGGPAFTFALAGLLAVGIGTLSYRQMTRQAPTPLRSDLARAWQRRAAASPARAGSTRVEAATGYLIALEGGDGAGKSTQARLLSHWLRDSLGHEVVLTREPGATSLGAQLRRVLLDSSGSLSARAEALLFAADRAEHVATVIRPALDRGAVVLTDRYVDSSLAYQGAGRALEAEEVARLSRWATEGLLPHLTVVLDLPPDEGRRRRGTVQDRLEAEPDDFHDRVRRGFLELVAREPSRYLVVDATEPPERVQEQIRARLHQELPSGALHREQALPAAPASAPGPSAGPVAGPRAGSVDDSVWQP